MTCTPGKLVYKDKQVSREIKGYWNKRFSQVAEQVRRYRMKRRRRVYGRSKSILHIGSNPILTTKAKDMKCKTCFELMNPKRLELGYRICITCSVEPKWSSVPVINHKTGNEIQIVKDPEVAAEFLAKSARKGFGTLKGMSSSYKRQSFTAPVKIQPIPDKIPPTRELSRRPLPNEFESVGSEVMDLMESSKIELAYEHIEKALAKKRIYKIHAEQLKQIIQSICEKC